MSHHSHALLKSFNLVGPVFFLRKQLIRKRRYFESRRRSFFTRFSLVLARKIMKKLIIFGHVSNLQFVLDLGVFQNGDGPGIWRKFLRKLNFLDRFFSLKTAVFRRIFSGVSAVFQRTGPFIRLCSYPAPPPCQGIAFSADSPVVWVVEVVHNPITRNLEVE